MLAGQLESRYTGHAESRMHTRSCWQPGRRVLVTGELVSAFRRRLRTQATCRPTNDVHSCRKMLCDYVAISRQLKPRELETFCYLCQGCHCFTQRLSVCLLAASRTRDVSLDKEFPTTFWQSYGSRVLIGIGTDRDRICLGRGLHSSSQCQCQSYIDTA